MELDFFKELIQSLTSDIGTLGALFSLAGWAMYWFERRDRISKDKKLLDLSIKNIDVNIQLKKVLDDISRNLDSRF